MVTSIVKGLLNVLPSSVLAGIVAEYLTKALQKIGNKEKAALISKAVKECGDAVTVCGKAVEDCTITEAEIESITTEVKEAVVAIVEAAK